MQRFVIFLILFLTNYVSFVHPACTHSLTTNADTSSSVRCNNVTLSFLVNEASQAAESILVFKSLIPNIEDHSFRKFSQKLMTLSINDCGLMDAGPMAFSGLVNLKKLSLSNNLLTRLKSDWFLGLSSLEQLDVTFNLIKDVDPLAFGNLRSLRRLDLSENRITCIQPDHLLPMASVEKFRFSHNPFDLKCRFELMLYLHDHGIKYDNAQYEDENWLDGLLWRCNPAEATESSSESIKECVLLNLFVQLRSSFVSNPSPALPQQCTSAMDSFTRCLATPTPDGRPITNGNVVKKLLLNLNEAKSTV
ncbi:leucine-rich repeat and transmembrane domain-containing protein 2-like [Prorops nasuta]|uniref:leucine-rich repeat and transmembrane domain-containing protein 2-like n=1 Tax=Prorops nasuta TaxID=863751 RepID=UPI0034CDBEF5